MTSKPCLGLTGVPFIIRYAKPALDLPGHTFRYDPDRQISQVLVEGRWVDSPDAHPEPPGTRLTRVRSETSDDQ